MSFWTEADEHHQKIARTFYENIETYSPDVATGGKNDCFVCPNACPWCATRITYSRYTGPRIQNI